MDSAASPAPPAPASTAAMQCLVCAKPSGGLCSGCNHAAYCCKACQKTDWHLHKHLCKPFSAQLPRPQPDDGGYYRRALVFPADSTVPKFVWCGENWNVSQLVSHLTGKARSNFAFAYLYQNRHKHYVVAHNDKFLVDDSKPNQALGAAFGPLYGKNWRADIMLFKRVGPVADDDGPVADIGFDDVRECFGHFKRYAVSHDHHV